MPELPLLEPMLPINVQEYGISDDRPLDLVFTRKRLLRSLQHSILGDLLEAVSLKSIPG